MATDDFRKRVAERLGPRQDADDELNSGRMPLVDHLSELRKRLVYSLLFVTVTTAVAWNFNDVIVHFLELPLLRTLPANAQKLYFTGIGDKFFIYLKVAIYTGLFIASPLLLNELWKFVSPALYKKEKKVAFPLLFATWFAFVLGGLFSYYIVIPNGYSFLIGFGSDSDRPMITLTEYFSLTTQLLLALGCVFELPVAMVLLVRFGILEIATITKFRGPVYVGMAVLSAVVTPTPDAFTMLLVLIPLCLLFELSVIFSKLVTKRA